MTEIEADITGRMTAFQEVLSFLMGHHFAGLSEADARAVSASFLGRQRSLGIGMMDAADLQEIGQVADNTLSMILADAAHMAGEYRRLRGG
jgi:hypothetical protein